MSLLLVVGCASSHPHPQSVVIPEGQRALLFPATCTPYPMRTDTLHIKGRPLEGPFKSFVFDCEGKIRRALADTTTPWHGPPGKVGGW